MKKRINRLIAVMLAIVLSVQPIYAQTAKKDVSEYCFVEDGSKYSFTINLKDSTNFVAILTNEDTNDKTELIYNDGIAKTIEYSFKGRNFLGINRYNKTFKRTKDYRECIEALENNQVQAQAYGKETKLNGWAYTDSKGKEHYYRYKIGSSGKEKGYTKISCVYSYKVKNDATDYLDKFEDNVIESNNALAKAGVGAGVVVAIMALVIAFPALGIGALVPQVIAGGSAISLVIDSYKYYQKAKDCFNKAKDYGVRL